MSHILDLPFAGERIISHGSEIPIAGAYETPTNARGVQLVRTRPEHASWLRRSGAVESPGGWRVPRSADFPFDRFLKFLPRMARRSISAEVVDLIPARSWFASLANMLVASSWDAIRRPVTGHFGGCQECGTWKDPEAHEVWSYDPVSRVQTLRSIRSLCYLCHETQHLGRANVGGRLDVVFDRLCRLNRIRPHEAGGYREAIFGKWEDRSRVEWELDLSSAFEVVPHLFLKGPIQFGGDGWIFQPPTAGRDEMVIRLINSEVLTDGRRLVLLPAGTPPTSASG